ncbi:hypothetical protein DESA109040_21110 [Deinococcus saxicola]
MTQALALAESKRLCAPADFPQRPSGLFLSSHILTGWVLALLLKQGSHQRRPARLMRRAQAGSGISMKIFVEDQQVAPL